MQRWSPARRGPSWNTSTSSPSKICALPVCCAPPRPVVDRALVAAKIAAVRDATDRVREVLPTSIDAFIADRTVREVVTLNLMVAIQDCLDLAAHWLADAGWDMPETYADVFFALAEHAVIPRELATRLAGAAAFRNLVAHQYGALDWRRVYAVATSGLGDLDAFCARLADQALSSEYARPARPSLRPPAASPLTDPSVQNYRTRFLRHDSPIRVQLRFLVP